MEALHEGQQYGLSSQGNNSSNKTLIYVKLTDSAIRAIEECIKHRTSLPKSTIQFQDNQGIITIPRPSSPNNRQSFSFSLSSIEADGPQGSFECLHQPGSNTLQSLGSMQYKMNIHANDDSYEKTRFKMAVAEKESKMNCAKVIKVTGGPYVGRKVKVKRPLTSIPPPKAPSPAPYISRPTSKPLSTINSGNGHHHNHSSNNNHSLNSKQHSYNKTGNPDVLKKSYRDRIIHHLALRSYKRPALISMLSKDGNAKEKDRKNFGNILNQVAVVKDNTYSLARHVWNEVRDDWPFYTPEDVEIMRRNKPQNLTPPNENGNRSPTSTSLGNSPSSQKRQTSTYDHQPNKKQRISHYNKMDNNSNNSLSSRTGFKSDSSAPLVPKSDSLSQPNRRELPSNGYVRNNWHNSLKTDIHSHKSPLSEGNSHIRTNGNVHVPTHHSRIDSEKPNHKSSSGLSNGRINSMTRPTDSSQMNSTTRLSPDSNIHHHPVISNRDSVNKVNGYKSEERHNNIGRPKEISTTNGSISRQSTPASSPESRDSLDSKDSNCRNYSPTTFTDDEKEFKKKYVVISNGEQRARYKADFNNEYSEYLGLHSMLTNVSNKFNSLDESLRSTKKGSEEWHRIRREILKEYEENQRDQKHQNCQRRFHYLHEKLTHIKMLVNEYDRVTQAGKS